MRGSEFWPLVLQVPLLPVMDVEVEARTIDFGVARQAWHSSKGYGGGGSKVPQAHSGGVGARPFPRVMREVSPSGFGDAPRVD